METFVDIFAQHWTVWLTTLVLIVAAVIDGVQLKVPNWITFPMILTGWAYSAYAFGWEGFGWSMVGAVVGLGLLLPAYAIGGMGAGDVKLLAGVGSWMYVMLDATQPETNTAMAMLYSFAVSAVIGALLAVAMVVLRKSWSKHYNQFWLILNEIGAVKSPTQLSEIAAERKSSMLLLPYGIPIAIGTIAYFAWTGMLI
ncbi:MAG: prepilin peptidase [Pirellulaceae bacterium]|jgi:prepilin peptidase CpaA|nr:prepilin peptidase [Pirellulaceae bacterium]MDP6720941.1 prepilin peptidase [Pirellulaceae bacterium]MDP7015087.1 prepilin peptidase [Pirellulaceae bacterium]